MTTAPTTIPGVFLVSSPKHGDERGYLQRVNCDESLAAAGLNTRWVQSSITSTPVQGTLRGMHFQKAPFGEIKLIRAVSGKVWDCLVDVRPNSPTFGKWEAFELSEENGNALYIPEGIAHGFYTLANDVRMLYSMSMPYYPGHASGILWNDPALSISWPEMPTIVSVKDEEWPVIAGLLES